ncbi:MAG: hypothetical protein HFF84_05185 [Oscillibacter sp.]|nr:hypothetical protein [Oscillibacter sp.]
MKHKKGIALLLLLFCVAIVVSAINTPEKRTIRYFNSHRIILEEDIMNTIETGQASSRLKLTFNYWDGEHPIVEYIVVNSGIVSASQYYGFFYSFDNEPVSFQNADESLIPISEQEWNWIGEGDNRGIVRRLDTNWFYFEAFL